MGRANKVLHDYKIRKIALGISIILFFGTFPYWLIDSDSKFSILNVIFNKITEGTKNTSLPTGYEREILWSKFYSNLLLTIIGLMFYYFSNFSKYLGSIISKLIFTSFSHSNNKNITIGIQVFKSIAFLGLLLTIYVFIINLIEVTEPPKEVFNLFLLAFFVVLIIWNTGYPDFESINTILLEKQSIDYDFRNDKKLVKLKSNQIAYVNKGTSDFWELHLPEKVVDMSYGQVFVYDVVKFSPIVSNLLLLETACGIVKATCEIVLDVNKFPKKLSTQERQIIETVYGHNNVVSFISRAIKKEKLKNELEKMFLDRKRFNMINSENPESDADSNYEQLFDKISSSKFDASFTNQINESLKNILLNELVIKKVEITITENTIEDTFKDLDEDYKQLKAEQRVSVKERESDIRKAGLDQQNILISALVEKLKSPATPEHVATDLIQLVQQIKTDPNPTNIDKGMNILNGDIDTIKAIPIDDKLTKASEIIGLTIHVCKLRNYSKEDMIEKISVCTSFFDEKGIDVDTFLHLIFTDLEIDKEERTEEEYVNLSREHLLKLLEANG